MGKAFTKETETEAAADPGLTRRTWSGESRNL